MISLGFYLSADPNNTYLSTQTKYPRLWPEYEWGMEKMAFGVQ